MMIVWTPNGLVDIHIVERREFPFYSELIIEPIDVFNKKFERLFVVKCEDRIKGFEFVDILKDKEERHYLDTYEVEILAKYILFGENAKIDFFDGKITFKENNGEKTYTLTSSLMVLLSNINEILYVNKDALRLLYNYLFLKRDKIEGNSVYEALYNLLSLHFDGKTFFKTKFYVTTTTEERFEGFKDYLPIKGTYFVFI